MHHRKLFEEKLHEAITSVLPITLIVLALCFTITPIPNSMLVSFAFGAIMLIAGMAFFTLGADTAMTPIGNKAGARGGTVIKARRSGGDHTEKFFGFSIASEKELHFLVTPVQGRNHIMKSIMEHAGLESKAQSIVFSLPVSHAIGLQFPEE